MTGDCWPTTYNIAKPYLLNFSVRFLLPDVAVFVYRNVRLFVFLYVSMRPEIDNDFSFLSNVDLILVKAWVRRIWAKPYRIV